jgi:FkbM family methyltransferase
VTSNDAIQRTIAAAAEGKCFELFDRVVGPHEGLVIAGASGLVAEHTLAGLARLGLRPVALADNNPARWNTTAHGVVVVPPGEAIHRYPNAAYVAAIFTHTPLRQQLQTLGATRVVSYAPLFHRHPATFLPYFAVDDPAGIAADGDAVQRAAGIWADEESAALYAAVVDWFVTLDSDAVPRPLPASATYLPDVLRLRDDEVFVDCGAFDGDTALTYAAACGGRYHAILALEPDPRTFAMLTARVAALDRTTTMNAAVGATRGSLSFIASGGLSSHAASAGARGIGSHGPVMDVPVVTLDGLAPRPTFVKMDIEGFEHEALAGARTLLSGGDTAFAVTLYHRMSDLWTIPLFIHACAPQLRLFLRHYAEDWAETVCYAVPADRVRLAPRA